MLKAFLFPGQGSQYSGMGKDLYDSYNSIKKIYHTAVDILGFDIAKISFENNCNNLDQTKFTQPAIFVHSIAIDSLLKSNKIVPDAVAGHSLGEFSALVSNGVLKFEDALRIVKLRANAMYNIGKETPGIMAALLGANQKQLEIICNQDGIVVPANINTSEQVVISGEEDSVNNAIKTAKSLGIKQVVKLNVSGAFHSPLMTSVRKPLLNIINSINFNNTKIPIYQNNTAQPVIEANLIKKNLVNQLESPVLWMQTILNMKHDGISNFIEVGPRNVLAGLNRKIYPEAKTLNYNKLDHINSFELL